MAKRLIKLLLGIIMIPLAGGFVLEFYGILREMDFGLEIHKTLVYGFLAYIPVHVFLHKPIMTYVFAHELTHTLWAFPFGGKLKDFRVGEQGGHAVITKSNLLVDLAPYFFPFFSYLILGLFGIFILAGARSKVFPYTCFLTGLSLSFHLLFTAHSLLKKQGDLKNGGILLSPVIIIIMNVFFIVLALKILDPGEIHFLSFLKDSVFCSAAIITGIRRFLPI